MSERNHNWMESNIIIGLLLDVPRVLVDLPTGYAGKDYLKDDNTTLTSLREVYKKVTERIKELEELVIDADDLLQKAVVDTPTQHQPIPEKQKKG